MPYSTEGQVLRRCMHDAIVDMNGAARDLTLYLINHRLSAREYVQDQRLLRVQRLRQLHRVVNRIRLFNIHRPNISCVV
jgi:hypothetical protein